MVIVHIYAGIKWKSDMNMPFVIISTKRKAAFGIFTDLKI